MNDKSKTGNKIQLKWIGVIVLVLALSLVALIVYTSTQPQKNPLDLSDVELDLSGVGVAGSAVKESLEDTVKKLQSKPSAPKSEKVESQKNEPYPAQ